MSDILHKKKVSGVLPLNTPGIAAPSPGLLRRLIGDPLSQGTANKWPELRQAWAGMQSQYPRDANKVSHIGEMGPLSKMIHGDADAITGPFGSIKLNRDIIAKNGQNVNDVLAHELTHVGQGPMAFIRKMFGDPTVESDAVDREALRNRRTGNIDLRAPYVPRIKKK